MKENEEIRSEQDKESSGMNVRKMRTWIGLTLVLAVFSMLCLTAAAQETANDWVNKGDDILLYKTNAGIEAIEAYERALQLDPQNESILLREATIYHALGEQAATKALGIVEKKLETNPRDVLAWRQKGGILHFLGMEQEANQSIKKSIEILDQEIEKNSENGTAWWYKAESLVNLFKFDDALTAYEKVIELDHSRKVDAWIGKGNALWQLGRTDEAVAAYDKAIELDPTNIVAWFSKGSILDSMGRSKEAEAAYAKANELKELESKD